MFYKLYVRKFSLSIIRCYLIAKEQNQYHMNTIRLFLHQFHNQDTNSLKSSIAMLVVAFDQVFYMDIIDTAFLSSTHMVHLRDKSSSFNDFFFYFRQSE